MWVTNLNEAWTRAASANSMAGEVLEGVLPDSSGTHGNYGQLEPHPRPCEATTYASWPTPSSLPYPGDPHGAVVTHTVSQDLGRLLKTPTQCIHLALSTRNDVSNRVSTGIPL